MRPCYCPEVLKLPRSSGRITSLWLRHTGASMEIERGRALKDVSEDGTFQYGDDRYGLCTDQRQNRAQSGKQRSISDFTKITCCYCAILQFPVSRRGSKRRSVRVFRRQRAHPLYAHSGPGPLNPLYQRFPGTSGAARLPVFPVVDAINVVEVIAKFHHCTQVFEYRVMHRVSNCNISQRRRFEFSIIFPVCNGGIFQQAAMINIIRILVAPISTIQDWVARRYFGTGGF